MGYQVDLPGEYTLTKREGLVSSAGNENEDVVAASNDESLMESLAGYVDSIMPQVVFSANDGTHFITITNETTKVVLWLMKAAYGMKNLQLQRLRWIV